LYEKYQPIGTITQTSRFILSTTDNRGRVFFNIFESARITIDTKIEIAQDQTAPEGWKMNESNLPKKEKNVYILINAQIFPLKKSVTTIGRKLDNDLVLQNIEVSRNHAEIRLEDGKYTIHDLNSTSGTYLNNKKIDESTLYSGDLILVADVPMMFIDESWTLDSDPEKATGELRKKKT
jgi:pSer/pThr/pTyr-binding forkhead associated (FHA) protein